jgi:Uma2 family endonuclease
MTDSCGGDDMAILEIAVQSDRSTLQRGETVTDVRLRRWTREEYDRMVEAGILTTQDKVQLIEGEIVEMTPQKSPHFTTYRRVTLALNQIFGDGYDVRPQGPLVLDPDSEPEPDIAVVAGSIDDYEHAHPRTALLVVEVSDSSLRFDRSRKARVYARAGIADYWIVNVPQGCLEVFRDPVSEAPPDDEPHYTTAKVYKPGESVAPLAMPDKAVAVDDLLPRAR